MLLRILCGSVGQGASYHSASESCEHTFVTSQGHPHARFRRALATGNPRIAEAAAREVRRLNLADALDLCLLYRQEPERYERAAARWIARLIEERPALHLSEIELAEAGFREALYHQRGEDALRGLLEIGRFAP